MALNFQDSRATRSPLLIVLLLVISIACVVVYGREGDDGMLHSIQQKISGATAPVQSIGAQVGSSIDLAQSSLSNATADDATLSELRKQNEELRELLAQAEEYRLEAIRLQNLLNIVDAYDIVGVTSKVIGRSSDAWDRTVTLDVGENEGVDAGQTVVGPSGVVGQVVSTTANTAVVRLITDPKSGVAALLQSNRAEGIVTGSIDGMLYLEGVDANITVQVGDLVLTSGLGGSYTRGLLIGTVIKVDTTQGESMRRIVVAPNVQTGPLQEAVVVTGSGSRNVDIVSGSSISSNNNSGSDDSNSANASDVSTDASDAGVNDGSQGGEE